MNASPSSKGPGRVADGSPRRLLVVDGAEEPRRAVAEYFAARGYDVIVASDGRDALALTISREVDVIIMNATLPGLEGYEAAPILRKISPRARVILTVEADADARPRESQRAERFRCFPKPVNLEALAEAIEETGPAPDQDGEDRA